MTRQATPWHLLLPLIRVLREQAKGLKHAEKAHLVGKTLAERALSKGIQEVSFDRSGYKYMGRVKALAEGAREGGLKF